MVKSKNTGKQLEVSDKWQTSDHYLDVLYNVCYNDLTLDPTSPKSSTYKYHDIPNLRVNTGDKRIKSQFYYTESENCLLQNWIKGFWFMNPPFSNPLSFLEIFIYQLLLTRSNGIVLLKSGCIHNKGTGSIIWNHAKAICFHTPRLNYLNSKLQNANGTDFDSVSIYFGDSEKYQDRFLRNYKILGETRLIN